MKFLKSRDSTVYSLTHRNYKFSKSETVSKIIFHKHSCSYNYFIKLSYICLSVGFILLLLGSSNT